MMLKQTWILGKDRRKNKAGLHRLRPYIFKIGIKNDWVNGALYLQKKTKCSSDCTADSLHEQAKTDLA